jgi:hypothetical protein
MKKYFSIFIFITVLIACAEIEVSAQILETKDFEMKGCIPIYGEERFTIKTEAEFLKTIRGDASRKYCLENLEKIDFDKNSLLGINLNTGYCRTPLGLKYQAVKNEDEKSYALNITYFDPQGSVCRALSEYDLWVLVPKLPDDYEVKFDVKAVLSEQ